jgi:hypothetical protein
MKRLGIYCPPNNADFALKVYLDRWGWGRGSYAIIKNKCYGEILSFLARLCIVCVEEIGSKSLFTRGADRSILYVR